MADLLSISSSAVGVYQRVLGVVSNNIANVGTEGYVRQESDVTQAAPTFDGSSYLGTGANFQGIQRQYNAFIETSLRNATASLDGQQAMVQYANRVIDVMGSGEIGLSPALDRFFAAARSVSADPASNVSRSALLRETDGVASRFRDLSDQLSQLERETRQAMTGSLGEVNALAKQLGQINQELSRNRSLDRQSSALLDQRDLILRQIAERVNIQVSEAENGVVTVSVGGAGSSGALVESRIVRPLQADFDPQAPERLNVLLDPFSSTPTSISGITGGSFGGLTGFRREILEPAMANLDLLAKTFMNEVNRIHGEGVDAYGDAGQDLLAVQTQFSFDRVRAAGPLNVQAEVSDLAAFDGKDITLAFDAQAGQVYAASMLEPIEAGDKVEVTLNGLSKVFTVGSSTGRDAVAEQLRQFIDGTFGVQLRAAVEPGGRVLVSSSVMKSFSFDVRVSSESGRVQVDQSQGLWTATDRNGQRITGARQLEINGVTLTLQGNPQDGEQVIVHASSRAAAGLRSLQNDPLRVAAAGAFRVMRDTDNLSAVKATVSDLTAQRTPAPPAPVLGSRGGLASNPVASEAQPWVAQRVVPLATVAAGQRDVAIYLDPGAAQANLQIITRDGRHLLGTPQADGASFVSSENTLPAPFNPGSTYSADYLNQSGTLAWRDLSTFYGARARPGTFEVMGLDHVPVGNRTSDARLTAELSIPTGDFTLPEQGLILNGVALPTGSATIAGPQDMADLINASLTAARAAGTDAQKAELLGISAQVRDGVLEITRDATAGPDGREGLIELGFGSEGSPQLLAKMGFRTAAYLDGTMPEELLVFTSGTGDVKIGATFAGEPWDVGQRRQSQRQSPFEIRFTAADRYQIVDVGSDTVLAERAYSAGAAIDHGGLQIRLSADPRAGDAFRVDGNQDGRGDNANAVSLTDLEKTAVAGDGGSLTLAEAYLGVVDQLSNVTQQAQVSVKAMEVVKQQAVDSRESVSGVSLDEEAANLIRFQQAYQAAAKSLQVASQLFDAVIRI